MNVSLVLQTNHEYFISFTNKPCSFMLITIISLKNIFIIDLNICFVDAVNVTPVKLKAFKLQPIEFMGIKSKGMYLIPIKIRLDVFKRFNGSYFQSYYLSCYLSKSNCL